MFQLLRVIFADHSCKLVYSSHQQPRIILRAELLHLKKFNKRFVQYRPRPAVLQYYQQLLGYRHSIEFSGSCSNLAHFELVY